MYYILKDHLGSASVVTDSTSPTPQTIAEQRYYPYGETRFTSGTINTDKLFTGQRDVGLGLTHLVQVIGEAARKVSAKFQRANPEIPWRKIIGLRHRIVHDYMRVDEDILWQAVTNDLPELLPLLEEIMPEEDDLQSSTSTR